MEFRLSRHVRDELERRSIPLDLLQSVLQNPEQIVAAHGGTRAYQSRVEIDGRMYLLRIIVAEDVEPGVVVTAYRTTKISKYWRAE